jgi:hypothetical protein
VFLDSKNSSANMSLIATFALQLWLAALALAAPLTTQAVDNTWTYGTGGGILGFIVLILDIIVFSKCRSSGPRGYPTRRKMLTRRLQLRCSSPIVRPPTSCFGVWLFSSSPSSAWLFTTCFRIVLSTTLVPDTSPLLEQRKLDSVSGRV